MHPISWFILLVLLLWFLWTYGRWFAGVNSGAPFVPIPKQHLQEGMELLQLTKEDVVVDLGSGSGTILREVAKRGARGIGYEFHPLLVAWSKFFLKKFGDQIQIHRGDLFDADISQATVVTMFGLNPMREKIEKLLREKARPGTRVLVLLAPELSFEVMAKTGWSTVYKI